MPLKVAVDGNAYGEESASFLPGAYSLGEILETQGYNQTLLVGSDAEFVGRASYFTQHGNYKILDYFTAQKDGIIPEDYRVFWGFEDERLFEYAKKELSSLGSQSAPFNFTMLTVDTHHPAGYTCDLCEDTYEHPYSNAIVCSSRQVYDFVSWVRAQNFFENTTIIISGDHLSMAQEFFSAIPESYERTVYNVFLNSLADTSNTKNREFATFDMFPSTLASLGVEIKGERLGIGTNLFSEEKTVFEEYGTATAMEELSYKSKFYNSKILYKKK